jgi:hypothetical protein
MLVAVARTMPVADLPKTLVVVARITLAGALLKMLAVVDPRMPAVADPKVPVDPPLIAGRTRKPAAANSWLRPRDDTKRSLAARTTVRPRAIPVTPR